jgi:hypothetical protein
MMKTNTTYQGLFRRSTAGGLVLLLVLASAPVAEAGLGVKSDWSKVQAVARGTRTTVVLYKDQAPRGKRKTRGHFQSATAEAIRLLLPDGQTSTLQKRAVRKVLVPRPLKKRYQGWITLAVAFGVVQYLASIDGVSASEMAQSHVPLTVPATVIAFLVAPKMGEIYQVPLKHRDPSSTKTAPPKQRSGKAVPAVTKAAGDAGSASENNLLQGEAAPEILQWQARQRLMRKEITPRPLSGLEKVFYHGVSRADGVD